MDDTIALNESLFRNRVKVSKRKVIKKIEEQIMASKLEILKAELKAKNVPFDESINDYYDLIDHLRNTLDQDNLAVAAKIVEDSNADVENMVRDLKRGSSSSFTKFVTKDHTFNAKEVLGLLGSASLIAFSPIGLGIQILGLGVVGSIAINKLSKNNKLNLVKNKGLELDKIIQDLEVTRDATGNILDTRFDAPTIELIKNFFEANNVHYTDTGYLSLRQAIEDLDNIKKEKLCRLINESKGNPIDINNRLKGYSISGANAKITKKKKIIAGVLGTGGVIAASALIPGLGGALLAGPIAGLALKSLTGSKGVGWFAGICTPFLVFIAKYGKILSAMGAVNLTALGALAAVGIGLGALAPIGIGLIKAIKNKKKRFNLLKDKENLQALDHARYAEQDAAEMVTMEEVLRKNDYEQDLVINATCRFMDDVGITYSHRPATFQELKAIVESLDNKDKKRVYSFLSSFDEYVKGEPTLGNKVKNSLKSATAIGLSPLAGVSLLGIGDKVRERMERNNAESLVNTREETPAEEMPTAPVEEMTTTPVEEITTAPVEEIATTPTEEITTAPVEEVTTAPVETVGGETVPPTTPSLDEVDPLTIEGLPNPINLEQLWEENAALREMSSNFSVCTEEQLTELIGRYGSAGTLSNLLNILDPATYERYKTYILTRTDEERMANPLLVTMRNAYILNARARFELYKQQLAEARRAASESPEGGEDLTEPSEPGRRR